MRLIYCAGGRAAHFCDPFRQIATAILLKRSKKWTHSPSLLATIAQVRQAPRVIWLPILCALLLGACSKEQATAQIPPQKWKNYTVEMQSRPTPVVAGMDEFILIISKGKGRPAHDFIVSVRTEDTDPWKQMIQDGYMGVFRRAVPVHDPSKEELNVQIQEGDDIGYLRFPLLATPQPASAKG